MKIGIIGTGVVGGYYGALLARSGFDVNFLLRSDLISVKQMAAG
ncbi:MAG: 2-dehydropantoate 2-reductase N-terminal domain-containing protein [Desulfobacterales bacterium]